MWFMEKERKHDKVRIIPGKASLRGLALWLCLCLTVAFPGKAFAQGLPASGYEAPASDAPCARDVLDGIAKPFSYNDLAFAKLLADYEAYEARFEAVTQTDDLEENGYTVIQDQIFPVILKSFGEMQCRFVPAMDQDTRRLALFVTDTDGNVLWKTNQLETNYCVRGRLKQPTRGIAAVAFQDLNHDLLLDIILITTCENESGSYAGQPYKVGDVLYQEGGGFYRDWRVSDQINRFGMNKSVGLITAYARDGYSTEFLYTATTLDTLLDNGFRIFEAQHYARSFEKLGVLDIVPGIFSMAEYAIFMIYLVNDQGYIVWRFQPMEDYDNLYSMKGMACEDLDGDGMKDLAVLARYSYEGPGGELMVDLQCRIYYQRTGSFDTDREFSKYYQCAENDKLRDLVVKIRDFWGWEVEEDDKDTDRG